MVIHFVASQKNIAKNIELYRQIVRAIHSNGHILARDWIEPQYHAIASNVTKMLPEQSFRLNIDSIERCDAVVVEGTATSFSVGYQVAAALDKKKPLLMLIQNDHAEEESIFSQGIHDILITRKRYTKRNLEKIVTDFLQENTLNTKDLRFNFVIDRQLYNHIRWKSFKAKKTKAEIVRELLIQDMEKEDL